MYINRSFTSVQMCHTHTHLTHNLLTHGFLVAHANPSPSLFSFLHFPCHLYLSFAACWKKLTCGLSGPLIFLVKTMKKKGSGSNFKPSNPSMLVCLKTLEPEPSTTLKQKPAKESHPGKPKKQTPVSSVFVSKQIREKITHGFPKCQ